MSKLSYPKEQQFIFDLIIYYQDAEQKLIRIIAQKEAKGTVTAYSKSLLNQVKKEIEKLNEKAIDWTADNLPVEYKKGIESAVNGYAQLGVEIGSVESFSKLNNKNINIIVRNTMNDLTNANNFIGRKIEDDIRQAGLDAIADKELTGLTVKQTKTNLINKLIDQNVMAIKTRNGRNMNISSYAETVARSTSREAQNRGLLDTVTTSNRDLVKMSSHATTCPICSPLQGRVYSISGKSTEYPSLEVAYGGIYANIHPNCFVDKQVPILTSKGWKPIGDIALDDLVLTHKGRYRKVTYLHRNKGKQRIIKIQTNNLKSTQWANLTLTEGHPVMVNDEWVDAENVKVGDKFKVLAKKCSMCDNLTTLYRDTCSKECSKKATTEKRDTPEWREKLSKATSKQMKYMYKHGLIDTKERTKKAHEKTRQMVKDGVHPLQDGANHIKAQKSLGSKHHGKTWIEEKMGWYLTNVLNLDIESQHPIPKSLDTLGRQRYYFGDFLIKEKNIIIEGDGSAWHMDKEKDKLRQDYIESKGYTVLRFDDKQIKNDLEECGKEIMRILANHDHEYEFMDVEVTKVEIQEPKRTYPLYNIAVEEDESYIAKGFVVHNCRHILMPYVPELDEYVDKVKNFSNRSFDIDSRSKSQIDNYNREQKKNADRNRDRRQWERYKMAMPNETPKTFSGFRKSKASRSDKWQELESKYRSRRISQ